MTIKQVLSFLQEAQPAPDLAKTFSCDILPRKGSVSVGKEESLWRVAFRIGCLLLARGIRATHLVGGKDLGCFT